MYTIPVMNEVLVFDIGSQSLTVLALAPGKVWERAWLTRLARGGGFTPEGVGALQEAVLQALDESPVNTRPTGVCTGVFRRGAPQNVLNFLRKYVDCTVIPGHEEAILSAQGVSFRLGITEPFALMDPGGATTEVAMVHDPVGLRTGTGVDVTSLPMGAFTAGTPDQALETARNHGRTLASSMPLWGTGGTLTTLAALDLGLDTYDATRVNGHVLGIQRVRDFRNEFLSTPMDRLEAVPVVGKRAGALPVAVSIVLGFMEGWGAGYIRVADAGVRWGVAARRLQWRMP